ncbi:MAG: glycosyltransferase family 39 protein [Acidobacteriota bacterium]|nr:glycosyltransferase family 39 protein [Acidobacteriota bacterium]
MKDFRKRKALAIAALLIIMAAAVFLRFHRLGDRALYGDEPYFTVVPATQPLPEILGVNYGSILYPAILHFLLPLGQLEFMARLPSAVFGILAVWILYRVGRLVFPRRKEALMAAVFGATSGWLIFFSQQARGYSGMVLFSLLALYCFLRAVKEDRAIFWAGYALSLSIGIYMHLFMLIILPVHAAYVGVLSAVSWWKTKRLRWDHPAVCLAVRFAAASVAAMIAVYFLYLPTRSNGIEQGDLFIFLKQASEGLMNGRTELALLPYSKEVISRLLDHATWPLLFFFKMLLAALGLAAFMKNKTREWILWILYLTLPLVLFVFSNPAAPYQTIQTNKFSFLAPILYLLMAGGFGAWDSVIAGRRLEIRRGSWYPAGRTILRIALVAAILSGELLGLLEFRSTIWKSRAFPRNAGIVDHMKDRIDNEELVLSDSPINSLAFVFAKPIAMPRTGRPRATFFEAPDFYFQWNANVPARLWMVLGDAPFHDDDARRLRDLSANIEIHSFSLYTLILYPDRDRTLMDKVSHLMRFFKTLPIGETKRLETDLFLAYTFLLAGANGEALAILDALGKDDPAGWAPQPGDWRLDIPNYVFGFLSGQIDKYLLHNADVAVGMDGAEEAQALLRRIRPLDDQTPSFRSSVHTIRGDVLRLKGMNDAAEKEYLKALESPESPLKEADLIRKIGRLRGMPSAFMISQDGRTCRIRWWSEERREFSGRIEISEKISRIRGFRLTKADSHLKDGRNIGFRGVSQKGMVKGLTIETRRHARIEMVLRIEGIRSLEDHMIVFPDGDNPRGLVIR